MESFTDVDTRRPVDSISLAEGETKVVRLKKPPPGGNGVSAYCRDNAVAAGDTVQQLQDAGKHSLNAPPNTDGYYSYRIPVGEVTDGGDTLVQVTGVSAGTTELLARQNTLTYTAYAKPVAVTVKANPKRLSLGVLFDKLWASHPFNAGNPHDHDDTRCNFNCMMRFCDTLKRAGVSLDGLKGYKCGRGTEAGHTHHFNNPYDFEQWKPLSQAYVWKAAKPFQAEPMPGVAALRFMRNRWKGVVVLYNYYDLNAAKKDMYGGHIDLFDGTRICNDIPSGERHDGGFYRSAKIAFWPMERV